MKISRLAIVIVCALASASCGMPDVSSKGEQIIFQSESSRAVARAACNGDSDRLEELIKGGAEVGTAGRFGVTPLIWALTCHGLQFNDIRANKVVRAGVRSAIESPDLRYLASLKALLEAGADPNAMIEGDFGPVYPGSDAYWIDRYTPVLIAAEFHEPEVLALLLEYGGDPNAEHGDKETTALILAYRRGEWLDLGTQMAPFDDRQWQNMYLLLDAGARLELTPENQWNIIELASAHRIEIASQLLKHYTYTGDFEVIVYNLYNGLEMGLPGEQDRLDLLGYIRDVLLIDTEAVRSIYWPDPDNQPGP